MERIKCLKKWYIEIDGFIFKICCEKLFSAIIKLETAVCCALTKKSCIMMVAPKIDAAARAYVSVICQNGLFSLEVDEIKLKPIC